MIRLIKKLNKNVSMFAVMCMVMLASAIPAFADYTTATTDTDVNDVIGGFEVIYTVAKAGFKYLAIASIVVTTLVLAFFWLRGKLKQAVSGS